MAKTIEVRMKGVHKSLNNAIKKLNKSKDPEAIKLVAAMNDFNAKSKCGQSNTFKFQA
jgi:hypothetical protein